MYEIGMSGVTFKAVAKRAFAEAAEAVRWNKPVSLMLAFASPLASFIVTAMVTGSYAWGAVAGLAVAIVVFLILFTAKLVTVPISMANEIADTKQRDNDALQLRLDSALNPPLPDHFETGIFQGGALVGLADLGHSVAGREIQFPRIVNSKKLDPQFVACFQQQLFVIQKIDMKSGMLIDDHGMATDVLGGVKAFIVGTKEMVR
ncbi:MAG: hypothetical protein J0H88_05315 [Sphingomonadales bacterium]|nr:hypothetical protein [Sphingomonadales bacterium]